jgi:integrase/recombinase XerD
VRAPQIGFAQLVQDFFLRRLVAQRGASARTIEAYRDAFELLLGFAEQRSGKPAAALALADLDAPLVLDFLDHLETERGNSVRTRNARLAAIHLFMRDVAVRDPASLPITARVLDIPAKRFDRPVLGYLSRDQIVAILAAPDRNTWSGRCDAVLLATAYNTGARVSEHVGLHVQDVLLDRQTAVQQDGKGRKHRVIPLWKNTATELRSWLTTINPAPQTPVFPNRAGAPLTRSGVRDRLARAVRVAEQRCPSLRGLPVTPHTLRHSTAMHLLQSGTDLAVIAPWLGHESPATTHQYVEADIATKEAVLHRPAEPTKSPARFRASDQLLALLPGDTWHWSSTTTNTDLTPHRSRRHSLLILSAVNKRAPIGVGVKDLRPLTRSPSGRSLTPTPTSTRPHAGRALPRKRSRTGGRPAPPLQG